VLLINFTWETEHVALQKTPFLYLATLSGFSLLALDLYQPALPTITTFFKTTHNLGQLTMSMYLFVFGLAQLVWGPLLDHFGRKKCLPAGLILFLIGTILCIKAPYSRN
jgi:MFS family permease